MPCRSQPEIAESIWQHTLQTISETPHEKLKDCGTASTAVFTDSSALLGIHQANDYSIFLRRLTADDSPGLAMLMATPDISRYLNGLAAVANNIQAALEYIDIFSTSASNLRAVLLGVFGADNDNDAKTWPLIGITGAVDLKSERPAIFFAIEPRYRRQGIGKAVVQTVTAALHAFGYRIISAYVNAENTASQQLLAAVGFLHEGQEW